MRRKVLVSAYGMVGTLLETIERMFRQWRPYRVTEIKFYICTKSHKAMVLVSGTMASIYHDKVRISPNQRSYCSVACFAGTTLRIQVVKGTAYSLDIQDVVCNNHLIRALLPEHQDDIVVRHQNNCVYIMWPIELAGTNRGPRITIGRNGGMQYVGRMNKVPNSYAKV